MDFFKGVVRALEAREALEPETIFWLVNTTCSQVSNITSDKFKLNSAQLGIIIIKQY